ncbi:MAG TPA: hypothetical protein VHQ20_02425, partial [Patescibacteria group bacterium]|nr:hypothetical protein [Patescibacteria group bacterium]
MKLGVLFGCFLLLASPAKASELIASYWGGCFDGNATNFDNVVFKSKSNYQLKVYWSPFAGCEPTTFNPTDGFNLQVYIDDEGFYVTRFEE